MKGAAFLGLENKLRVNIGDILLLERDKGDQVLGYVKEFSSTRVRLSHEHPNNTDIYHFMKGDKSYNLKDFDKYKIIDLNSTSK